MGLRWAWRMTPEERAIAEAIGMTRRQARRALRKWTQPEPLDDIAPNTSGIFNPHLGLFGIWPSFHYSAFGAIGPGTVGDGVGYVQGILFWKANQPCRPVTAPGPYYFGGTTATCVRSFKAFFGIPGANSSTVDTPTWQAIQWCANNLPNRTL